MEVPQRGGSCGGGRAIVCCGEVGAAASGATSLATITLSTFRIGYTELVLVVGRMWEPWAKALPGFRLVPAASTPVGVVSLLVGVVVVLLTLFFR